MKIRAMLVVLLLLMPVAAQARNTEHEYPISAAVQSKLGKEKLLQVPFYFAGQRHPRARTNMGEWRTNKTSSGVFRGDQAACQSAFLSALIQLQKRALEQGANAIIDIESITADKPLASATKYRCLAGTMVVHVGLKGRLVKTRK